MLRSTTQEQLQLQAALGASCIIFNSTEKIAVIIVCRVLVDTCPTLNHKCYVSMWPVQYLRNVSFVSGSFWQGDRSILHILCSEAPPTCSKNYESVLYGTVRILHLK